MIQSIKNILFKYLLWTSTLMLLQVVLYVLQLVLNLNLIEIMMPNRTTSLSLIPVVLGSIFLFSVYNIPICGIAGIIIIVKKYDNKLGIICLSAALLFYLITKYAVGDSI